MCYSQCITLRFSSSLPVGVTCKCSRFFFFFQNTVWNDPASSYLGAMRKASRGTREKPARAPAPCSAWWWGWWWWWWRRRSCCAGSCGAGAAARTLLGGRYTPPGNSRGCPAGGDGAPVCPQRGRRTLEGGGARGHGAASVSPGDSDPDSSSCQTRAGHRFALVGRSVFLRGDPEELGAAAAGGESPVPQSGESPGPRRRLLAGCFYSGGISSPAVRAGSRTFSLWGRGWR